MTTTTTAEVEKEKRGLHVPGSAQLQRLGKSLMLPIALLPAAGILLRLGQDDLLAKIDAPVIGPFFDAKTEAGAEVLARIGLDTVKLKREGFTQLLNQGDPVEAGDPVIRVDLARVAPLVPSTATPVLVTDGRKFDVSALDASATGGEPVVTVTRKPKP